MARELRSRPWEATTSDGRELRQRPYRVPQENKMAELMRTKEFVATLPGLCIGSNGSIYNGQHTLGAIETTGLAQELRVTYNFPVDQIESLDSGAVRNTSTKLGMEGFNHTPQLGQGIRLLNNFLMFETQVAEVGAAAAKHWTTWHDSRYSDSQIRALVRDNPDFYTALCWIMEEPAVDEESSSPVLDQETGEPVMRKRKMVKRPVNLAVAAVFRCLALRAWPEGEDELDAFLLSVLCGFGIEGASHPALIVHSWVEQNDPQKRRRDALTAALFVLFKVWTAVATGAKIKRIDYEPKGPFPMPYRP
jgi:hypothetical protein